MAKSSSPVRIEQSLMDAASLAGATLHRSAAQQIEYWATIGRQLSSIVDPESLMAIKAGLMNIQVHKRPPVVVDPDALFNTFDAEIASGAVSHAIAAQKPKYQASSTFPGKLEKVLPDGSVIVGQFQDGVFTEQPIK